MAPAEPESAGVSVVIPCFNGERFVARCVASVRRSDAPPAEIVVVDDGSTDGTAAAVERLATGDGAPVRLVRLGVNKGPATARNAGAAAARGRYLFFLDCDTVLEPDALTAFRNCMESTGAAAVSGIYHREPLNDGWAQKYKARFLNYAFGSRGVFAYEVFNGAVGGIKRAVFQELGGYDERLSRGMDYENEEFGHRLSARYVALMDPAVQARHEMPDLARATALYFLRVSQWMALFVKRRKFESGGPATGATGFATVSLPLMVGVAVFAPWVPWAGAAAVGFAAIYLAGYGGFFLHLIRRDVKFLLPAVLVNGWFCMVVSAAAAWGVATALIARPRGDDRSVA